MIINSITDIDFYKLSVAQLVYHRFANVDVEYTFQCRNAEETNFYDTISLNDLLNHFEDLKSLFLTRGEKKYLQSLGYFEEGFLRWLQDFRFDPSQLHFEKDPTGKKPWILRAKGSWLSVILFETIILSIVNEVYFKKLISNGLPDGSREQDILAGGSIILRQKIEKLKNYPNLKLVEFGTRRRFSGEWQEFVVRELNNAGVIVGTSNVHLARKYNIPVKGSVGHEAFMGVQSLYPMQDSQKAIFDLWLDKYCGKLGICLTDTFGDEKFLKDFSFKHAKAYDGVRHDSGDPYKYTDMIIKMYKNCGIDPLLKFILFSDGLDVDKAIALHEYCKGKIGCSFGIGTNLTNDFDGLTPLSIVMKVTKSNGQPVAKLSANPEKASCEDSLYLEYVKHAIKEY